MRILVVSDEPEKRLWDYCRPEELRKNDLILSCGDLPPEYLEFLVTFASCPLLYVRGNHDEIYDSRPPEGCVCIENKIYTHGGVRILGLGGSMRYKRGPDMYTEGAMKRRLLRPGLAWQLARSGGFDILLTHAPARGYGDLEGLPHRGFECFNELLEKYRPGYMFYGHVHRSYGDFVRVRNHPSGTVLVNACGSYTLELPEKNET